MKSEKKLKSELKLKSEIIRLLTILRRGGLAGEQGGQDGVAPCTALARYLQQGLEVHAPKLLQNLMGDL